MSNARADQQQQQQQQEKGWSHLVAGGVAGCSAVLLLHPFDVVKTRLQVQDGLPGQLPMYRGTADAVRTIIRREGWRGLYAGLAPSMLGSTVSWGAYLYLYERLKSWHRQRQGIAHPGATNSSAAGGGQRLGATWNLLSAAQAGAMVCVLTNPIWLIKTRLALQQRTSMAAGAAAAAGGGGGAYRGIVDAFVRIGQSEGLRGYYKGFGPSLVLQTAHGALQFAAYEELKALAGRAGVPPGSPDRQLSAAEVSGYGAASKFLAAVTTYPTQVIRSRLQQRFEGRAVVYASSWQVLSLTWQREGLTGFYKGLTPSLMRVMPQSAITLAVYEGLVRLLEGQQQGGPEGQEAGQQQQQQQQLRWAAGGQQQQQQQGEVEEEQQRQRRQRQQQRRVVSLVDKMTPLIIAADSQAEQ